MRALSGILLALLLVVTTTSAWVRLAQSGLSCPNAPDCYATKTARAAADQSTSVAVARTLHRMSASAAGAVVFAMLIFGWRAARSAERGAMLALGVLAVGLATLGIYTPSTLPAVTLANLIGGMTMLGVSAWLAASLRRRAPVPSLSALRSWTRLVVALFVLQVAIGGMISAHYAAHACGTFPLCEGRVWPAGVGLSTFDPLRELAPPSDAASRSDPARQAVLQAHRMLAVAVLVLLAWLGVRSLLADATTIGSALLVLASAQLALGLLQTFLGRPLLLAVVHNVVAACVAVALGVLVHATPGRGASIR